LIYRLSQGQLVQEEVIPLPCGEQPPQGNRARLSKTKVALVDEDSLLVAQTVTQFKPYETRIELTAIDLPTRQARGRFRKMGLDGLTVRGGLVSVGPNHALLGALKTVLCIDLTTFQEICRARQIDDVGDVADEGADPEEQVAPDGFVYDSQRQHVYLLCSRFNEALLMRYRLDVSPEQSADRLPHFVLEARSSVLEGHDPAGLCLNPGGDGVTASFQVMDELIDLESREVGDWTREQEQMLRLAANQEPTVPQTARLGCLCIFKQPELQRRIDLYSEVERDFSWAPQQTQDVTGNLVTVGYRLSGARSAMGHDGFTTRPVYLDEARVAVGTPSGLLLSCDTASAQSERVQDFGSPINSLAIHPHNRLLLVSCADGALSLLSVWD
jgi:hypothetical protein